MRPNRKLVVSSRAASCAAAAPLDEFKQPVPPPSEMTMSAERPKKAGNRIART
jgi:hypothetical protein